MENMVEERNSLRTIIKDKNKHILEIEKKYAIKQNYNFSQHKLFITQLTMFMLYETIYKISLL